MEPQSAFRNQYHISLYRQTKAPPRTSASSTGDILIVLGPACEPRAYSVLTRGEAEKIGGVEKSERRLNPKIETRIFPQ